MVKTKVRAKTTATKTRSKSKQPAEPEALFLKGTIVAIPGQEAGNDFKLAKLLENVYEDSEDVRVAYLKVYEPEPLRHIYYQDTIQGEIPADEVIAQADATLTKGRLKNMGYRKTLYQLSRHAFTKVKALAKNFIGLGKEEEESDVEEEVSSSSDEEEEEEPARPIKKVTGKKGAAKKKEEEEEEMEEEDKPAPRRSTRSSAKKTEEVTRSTKKQKVTGKKGKATKEEDLGEEEEEEEEEEVAEEPKAAAKPAKGAAAKGGAKGKKGKAEKEKKPLDTTKYTKGQWNPNVTVVERNEMLEGTSNDVIDYESTKANNKNIIRAVYTKNHKLLEKCLSKDNFFSDLFQRWGVETDFNAIELAFKNKDKKAIQLICKAVKDKKPKLISGTRSALSTFDTGYQSRHAYGTFTRRVHMGRGNKELNAALNKDEQNSYPFDHITVQRIMESEVEPELLDMLRVNVEGMDSNICGNLAPALQSGNLKVAAYIANKLFKATGHGVNALHVEVLTKDDPSELSDFRKPSATAKTIGSAITPIHFACINPNAKILEALLNKVPEYSIADFAMHRPMHYAAACTGPEPLKLLISKSIDFREGTRAKVTPLMIACTYGREENVKVLLGEGDPSIVSYKTREGMTPIHCAAERGHLGCIKLLLEAGADIDAPGKNRMTPLVMAAANGHYDVVEFLLTSGAKILLKDKFKKSALILAIQNGHVKIASYLLKHGAEFNQADSSMNYPMHYAAAYGYEECLDVLKQAGADQNVSNALKVTPLTVALLKNNTGIMKKLLSYENTDVNCKDESGRTLIMCAIQALTKANYEQIRFLIKEKNADPNILDMQGATALHYVAQINAAALANSSANMNRYDTPEQRQEEVERLTKEYEALQIEITELLLDSGSDINKQNFEGASPFITALNHHNFKICKLFLKNKNLDITSLNKKDEGIYHFLANSIGQKATFEIFHDIADNVGNKNGLINHVDIQGFTPILKFIKVFARSSNGLLNGIFSEHTEAQLAKKQREWDEKHQQMLAKEPAKEEDVSLRGGARTFQTARKSTGAKAPRKMLGGMYGGFGGGLGGLGGYGDDDQGKDERPVTLSVEELEKTREVAEQEFGEVVDKFIALLKKLIDLGANLNDSVQRLRPFRKVLRTKDPKEQDLKLKMIAEIIKKRRAQQAQSGLFGNRYGGHYGGGLFGNQRQQQKSKRPIEYCPQGNQNALHLAQDYPHPKLIEFLLNSKSLDINQRDYMKRTPLYCFVKKQAETLGFKTPSSQILELLLNNKADPNLGNIQNELPAFMTVKLQKLHFLEALTRHGVNLNVTNKNGETPLILSVKNKQFQYAEVLLKAGADANIKGKRNRTALHYALNNSSAGADASFEMENLLLKHGAKINDVDDRGRTPLHYAFIKIGNPFDTNRIDPVEIVTSYCAQKDVDVTIKDVWGTTPLHCAAQRGSQVCALTLLTLGAGVNEKNADGNTPLSVAMISGHPNVAIMLMQSSASVDGEVNVVKKNLEEIRKKEKELKKAEKEKAKAETRMEEEKPTTEGEETTASETIEEEALVEIEELEQVRADEVEDEEFEEEEEEDDNQNQQYNQYGGYNQYGHRYGGGGLFGGYGGGGLFGNRHQQQHGGDLPEGKCSMFSAAIKKNYQGVAYLMLQSGYDLMSAIQDAMNDQKFHYVWTLLTKVEDQSVLHKTNPQGQNLFHTFALKGRSADSDLTEKIFNAFVNRGISFTLTDSEGRTPLHYSAQENFTQLFTLFLENGADINVQDKKGYTPFTLQLVNEGINEFNIQTYIKYHAAFDLRFKVTVKGDDIEMGPLTYLISKGNKNFEIFRQLINNKVSVNEADEDGKTGLMYSIKENSDKLVTFFLNYPDLDRGQKDNDGKTPIHYVVSPLEYGSYENERILELLAPYFDINATDEQGKAPIYYAYLQDSGVMAQKLKELGAKDNKPPASIKRAATSVIASVDWSKEEIDYEEDAEKFIEDAAKLEKNILEVEEKVKPDQTCDNPQQHEVLYDEKLGPYDLYMTKVDIQRGYYGGNVFYKMQVLHNKVRDYYTVLTRYGRIGETGQTQNTPHPSKEDAIEQFEKIFRSKAGNEWTKKDRFNKVKGKYRLLEFTKRINHKEYLTPFDLKNPKVPKCSLGDEIKTIVNDITDVKMYQQMMNTYNIDSDILPLASLNRSLLNEAQAILFEIRELIDDMTGERRQDTAARSNTKILEIREKISEKSSRFYELIPDSRYRNTPIPPIDNQHSLGEKSKMLDNLLDFEISSRVMLGALNKMFQVNPLDYCFQALTIKMMRLDEEHAEYQLIKQYVHASHTADAKDFIQNIYALERKGEAERYSQWSHLKNKMLLWHGSKIANFMGILGQGLRIAPPEAYTTGDMFGKGVYFADMFTKSYGYTQDWNVRKGYRLLLLCEVALGEMLELREAQNITDLQAPFKSVKGLGRQGPSKEHKLVMPNGCVAPIGQVINQYEGVTDYNLLPRLNYNEYIVYDVSQVRIRYLVQVKDV